MAGAMAGTALLSAPLLARSLHTVSLTINNACNLSCPHCYLQYRSPSRRSFIDERTINSVIAGQPRHICIVGKEPLSDRRSIHLTEMIIRQAHAAGISVSLVSNGTKLDKLSPQDLRKLSWIDLSLDGGRRTYAYYRKGDIEPILRASRSVQDTEGVSIRVLHTISRQNAANLDDMIAISEEIQPTFTMFSPFRQTRSSGVQNCEMLTPPEFVRSLHSALFESAIEFVISLDAHYLGQFDDDRKTVLDEAQRLFGNRLCIVGSDPIFRGMIRVTFDGLVMSPFEAIDTITYDSARRLQSLSLRGHFTQIREHIESCYNKLTMTPYA